MSTRITQLSRALPKQSSLLGGWNSPGNPLRPIVHLVILWLGLSANMVNATPVDLPTLGLKQVVSTAFSAPICLTHAGDGSQRLFVVEQDGRIWIIRSNAVLADPFLVITNRVLRGFEQGLLGLAFPPGFSTNGHFYIDYTRQPDGATVISRFELTADSNVADFNSEQVLLTIPQPYVNHNGGQLAFGPDGYLYIGMGDGGSEGDPQNNAQNPSSLLGKLLRIEVEAGISPYGIPASNPFIGNTNYAPEIWALGLRNPWRFSFDRVTGDLYIGDVGGGLYEEIDFQPAGSDGGQNYGWRILEGPATNSVPTGFTNFPTLVPPVASYDHATYGLDFAACVIGGYVYRGPSQPRMDGIYIFGDFITGALWCLNSGPTNWQKFELAPVVNPPSVSISTFGEDEQGRLYLADYTRGGIYQIQDTMQAWTPKFSVTTGTFISNITVSVTCLTPGAVIHYTTNGADPTESDPIVPADGAIGMSASGTNKARAFRSDLLPSNVASAVLRFVVANPTFSPGPGNTSNGTPVTISSATPGASLYYTTNLAIPPSGWPLYSGPVPINPPVTMLAFGAKAGYSNSATNRISYSLARVGALTFSPPNGPLTNGSIVTITCPTPEAVIRYTLDGTNPTTNSPIYTEPLAETWPQTVLAQAFIPGWASSPVLGVFYGLLSPENTVVTTLAGASVPGFTNGLGTMARFSSPAGICMDPSGNLFVADLNNNVIREILPSGEVLTFAGSGQAGSQDGPASQAQFSAPVGLGLDRAGNLYVADSGNCSVRLIDISGNVSTLASVPICSLWQLGVDPAGVVYAGADQTVVKVLPDGNTSTFASGPDWAIQVAPGLDEATNVYVATEDKVWKISPDGSAELFAGSSRFNDYAYSDGPKLLARFQGPQDIAVDATTNVFVADAYSIHRIASDGWTSTFAGGAAPGYANGRGWLARFGRAASLCVDPQGNVYVADFDNNCIRKIWVDSSGIGIPDAWQLAHFGHIGIDPNADPDHDGMSNYAEFWAGTDPLDRNSCLALTASVLNSGSIQLRWPSVAGKGYLLSYSSDMLSWTPVTNPLQGDGSVLFVTDQTPLEQASQRFYRVAVIDF